VPRPHMKRAIPQKSFLPDRLRRIVDDGAMTAALPGIAESLQSEQRMRRAARTRGAVSSAIQPIARSRPSVKKSSGWLDSINAWLKRRAERRALRQATERLSRAQGHLLKDIGITKTEIAHRVLFAREHDR
jgi:uncharacterized protein YjiS (DUF1127 family)